MSHESTRDEHFNWPSDKPVWTIGVLITALAVFLFTLWLAFQSMTLLQQYWFEQYCWTNFNSGTSYYRLLKVNRPGGEPRRVLPEDIDPGQPRVENKVLPFQLTQQRLDAGEGLILDKKRGYDNAELRDELQQLIYDGITLKDQLRKEAISALWVSVPVLIIGLIFVAPKDRERARIRKYGRRIDGPEFVSTYHFNRRNESDGIGFVNTARATLMEWILCLVLRRDPHQLRIPNDVEAQHILCMGDNGTGKTSIFFNLLEQIAARGEIAVLFDSAMEFVSRFYNPTRGDIIANPLEARGGYWALEEEADNEPETLTLANSLFPDRPDEHRYFSRGTREVFAELLASKPSAETLATWLRDDAAIDRHATHGTYAASYLAPTAQPQRQGILSDLKAAGKAFSLLPGKEQCQRSWSTRSWAKRPRGWIFLTSTPDTHERLRPLISLWLDLLALRLMTEGLQSPGTPRVWFILDELAALQRLPQLHNAVRASRKSNCVVVMGVQGRSQMKENYGIAAEVMLSQPNTKIYLRTNEAESARWISETIGEQELEVLRETRSVGHDGKEGKSFQLHIEKRLLIMPSLISGLKSLRGFLKLGNDVVRLRFPYRSLPKIQPGFVPRPLEPTQPSNVADSTNTNDEKLYWR